MSRNWLERPIEGVLLDITGVLYESGTGNGTAIPGSVEAFKRLKASGIPVRLVTNETCATRSAIVNKLRSHGFELVDSDICNPAPVVVSILKERGLRPHLLVSPEIECEFVELEKDNPTCVVLGDADEEFSFQNMNLVLRTLLAMKEPLLFSLGKGRYYKHKGQIQLDVGAYAAALEFACGINAEVVGKPSPHYFGAVLQALGVTASEAVMVGDDIVSDVGGAQACGIRGVLVRTGKYTPNDENHPTVKPDFIADTLEEVVNLILKTRK
ncbi:phospholysine phosphohistidine inorganic pyrophosphate phosphatase [Oratosquilla oratoria]|uniref:phospholysine phosphohistidine inorganic pyrophosphate phosphatase n=1 Tax=Oratosquilla oratoria TaxID=337810 RepID=UPI003F75872F